MRYTLHFHLVRPEDQLTRGATFAFNHEAPIALRGPQALANRFFIAFFSTKGSSAVHPEFGSKANDLFSGNYSEAEDLASFVAMEVADVASQLRAIDAKSPWLSADERLQSATMTRFVEITDGVFEVVVELRTASGVRLSVLLPFAVE